MFYIPTPPSNNRTYLTQPSTKTNPMPLSVILESVQEIDMGSQPLNLCSDFQRLVKK